MNEQLLAIYAQLGIAADYPLRCSLPAQEECAALVEVGPDAFGRPARLEADTARAWEAMQAAALRDGVQLQLVSAYRSYEYQKQLLLRKLARGDCLADILKVNAAPGFSEHHSGRALDLGTPGSPPLEEVFEDTQAFAWLQVNARRFGFRLSFPRNNTHGVLYEPWHWYYAAAVEPTYSHDSSIASSD
jgi:D-alanyl-D-alanine carboxypeptidase